VGLAIGIIDRPAFAGDHDPARSVERSEAPRRESIRAADFRALPLLVRASPEVYRQHRDCFSCHNHAVSALALGLARQHGFAVGAHALRAIAEHTEADLSGVLDDYRKGRGQPTGAIRAGYALWALEAAAWPRTETTDAVVRYLGVSQRPPGLWSAQANRPPSESSDFTATALALRGLPTIGTPAGDNSTQGDARKEPTDQSDRSATTNSRGRALCWLKQTNPRETEDRLFRLWGLRLAGASSRDIAAAASELFSTQRSDGGWSQLDPVPATRPRNETGLSTLKHACASDACGTGSALVALHLAAGVATDGAVT
jgi:hypothetical protein